MRTKTGTASADVRRVLWLLCGVCAAAAATERDPRDIADEFWQQAAGAGSASSTSPAQSWSGPSSPTAPTASGWSGGEIVLQRIGGADSSAGRPADAGPCAGEPGRSLKRADLALLDRDTERWAAHMAAAIRGGCSGRPVDERLTAARRADRDKDAERDALLAAAVRRDRPEVFTGAGRSVARSLGPAPSGSGWANAVLGLASLAAEVKRQRSPATPPAARGQNSSGNTITDAVYADVFVDTQGSVTVTDDKWQRAHDEVRAATGNTFRQTKRVEEQFDPDEEFEKLPESGGPPDPGLGGGGLAGVDPGGGQGGLAPGESAPGEACLNPSRASDSTCEGMPGKRPGSVCHCCPGVYGIDHCYWSAGNAPPPVTHKVCRIDFGKSICGDSSPAWVTRTVEDHNNIDNSYSFYGNNRVRADRRGVRDVRVTHLFRLQCGARPANTVGGPVDVSGINATEQVALLRSALERAQEQCCSEIGANVREEHYQECRYDAF